MLGLSIHCSYFEVGRLPTVVGVKIVLFAAFVGTKISTSSVTSTTTSGYLSVDGNEDLFQRIEDNAVAAAVPIQRAGRAAQTTRPVL